MVRGLAQRRRRDDEDGRRFGRPVAQRVQLDQRYESPHTLHRRDGGAGDGRLHVVGTEKQDHQIDRRMRVENGRQDARAVAVAVGQMLVEGCRAAAQAFRDHLGVVAERGLKHDRPPIFT